MGGERDDGQSSQYAEDKASGHENTVQGDAEPVLVNVIEKDDPYPVEAVVKSGYQQKDIEDLPGRKKQPHGNLVKGDKTAGGIVGDPEVACQKNKEKYP